MFEVENEVKECCIFPVMQTKLDEWYEQVEAARLNNKVSISGSIITLHRNIAYKLFMGILGLLCGSIGWVVDSYVSGAYFFALAVVMSLLGLMVTLGVFKTQKFDFEKGLFTAHFCGLCYKKARFNDFIIFGTEVGSKYGISMYHSKVRFAKGLGIQVASFWSEKKLNAYNSLMNELLNIGRSTT